MLTLMSGRGLDASLGERRTLFVQCPEYLLANSLGLIVPSVTTLSISNLEISPLDDNEQP